jgi:hypothetical protein
MGPDQAPPPPPNQVQMPPPRSVNSPVGQPNQTQ